MQADDRAIRDLHERWLQAEREGRPDAVLALCTPDIIMQPPVGEAVRGQSAVADLLAASAGAIEDITITGLTIDVAEELAIKRARFATRVIGRAEVITGTHLWLLRPRWRVAFVTWSLDRLPG